MAIFTGEPQDSELMALRIIALYTISSMPHRTKTLDAVCSCLFFLSTKFTGWSNSSRNTPSTIDTTITIRQRQSITNRISKSNTKRLHFATYCGFFFRAPFFSPLPARSEFRHAYVWQRILSLGSVGRHATTKPPPPHPEADRG